MKLYVIGRQAELSQAELESLGAKPQTLTKDVVLDSANAAIAMSRLGGSIKQAELLETLPSNINEQTLLQACLNHLQSQATNGLTFGLSWYGYKKPPRTFAVKLKKNLRAEGKIRFVLPQKSNALDAAAVIHNKLVKTRSELLIVKTNTQVYMAATTGVQDIAGYSARDYNKPCRDSRVGMLPPKLSQILINLTNPAGDATVLDPFCGSGSLLMEAQLMGFDVQGSDLDTRMVECAKVNTAWLQKNQNLSNKVLIQQVDALELKTPQHKFVIAAEGYLGRNFSNQPSLLEIETEKKNLDVIYAKFFENLSNQANQPNKIALCVPVWYIDGKVLNLKVIDQITKFGYTSVKLQSADAHRLIYHREGQFVGRQILVLTKS